VVVGPRIQALERVGQLIGTREDNARRCSIATYFVKSMKRQSVSLSSVPVVPWKRSIMLPAPVRSRATLVA
jgi:hypothetical protein